MLLQNPYLINEKQCLPFTPFYRQLPLYGLPPTFTRNFWSPHSMVFQKSQLLINKGRGVHTMGLILYLVFSEAVFEIGFWKQPQKMESQQIWLNNSACIFLTLLRTFYYHWKANYQNRLSMLLTYSILDSSISFMWNISNKRWNIYTKQMLWLFERKDP